MEKDKNMEQFHMAKERYQLLRQEVIKVKAFVDSKNLQSILYEQDRQEVFDKLEILFEDAYHDSLLKEIHVLLEDAVIYVDEVKRKRFDGYDLSDMLKSVLNGITAGLENENKKEVAYKVEKAFMEHDKYTYENFFRECAKHASEIAGIIDTSVIG